MSALLGIVFVIAAIIAVPALGRLLVAAVLWAIVLAGIVLVGGPIVLAVAGIASL